MQPAMAIGTSRGILRLLFLASGPYLRPKKIFSTLFYDSGTVDFFLKQTLTKHTEQRFQAKNSIRKSKIIITYDRICSVFIRTQFPLQQKRKRNETEVKKKVNKILARN